MEMKVVGILSAEEARVIVEKAKQEEAMKTASERELPELFAEIAKGIEDSASRGETSFTLTVEENMLRTYDNNYYFAGKISLIKDTLLSMLAIAGYDADIVYNGNDTIDINVAW